ncbi:hypothetical protein Tco_1316368 [Tanacetum coccineum]
MVCTRLDIASADVGMLDKFDRGLQINVQVFVDFDCAMAAYMTLTKAAKEAIWLKGLAIESGFELKIVAGIATGALCYPWFEVPARITLFFGDDYHTFYHVHTESDANASMLLDDLELRDTQEFEIMAELALIGVDIQEVIPSAIAIKTLIRGGAEDEHVRLLNSCLTVLTLPQMNDRWYWSQDARHVRCKVLRWWELDILFCMSSSLKVVFEGLLQNRQAGGEQSPQSMRLDVPKFSGDGPYRWIFAITEYFPLLNTPADQHLFEESVKNRFGPSKYEDPRRALSKLLQLGTGEDYQREFEKLMNRVTDIPDSLLISFYISGLKLNLQYELLVSRPTTLGDAFSLARITEAPSPVVKGPLNADEDIGVDEVRSAIDCVFDMGESNMEGMEVRSKFGEFSENNKSVEEVVSGGEALGVGEDHDSGNAAMDGGDDAVKSEDISILNSLIGHGNPRFSQLCETIDTMDVQVLIDKEVDKEVKYDVYTLYVLIPFLKHLNDHYIKKKKMKATMQRRLWDPGIKKKKLGITLRARKVIYVVSLSRKVIYVVSLFRKVSESMFIL